MWRVGCAVRSVQNLGVRLAVFMLIEAPEVVQERAFDHGHRKRSFRARRSSQYERRSSENEFCFRKGQGHHVRARESAFVLHISSRALQKEAAVRTLCLSCDEMKYEQSKWCEHIIMLCYYPLHIPNSLLLLCTSLYIG